MLAHHLLSPPFVRTLLALCGVVTLSLLVTSSAQSQTLYAASSSGTSINSLNTAANGIPSASGLPATTTPGGPHGLNITGDGRFLLQANAAVNTVGGWAIGPDHSLTTTGAAIATLSATQQTTVSPDGKTLYVSSATNDAGINAYAIGANGALTLIDNEFVDGNGNGVVVTPNGKYLYAMATGGICDFSVLPDGKLEPLNGPAPVTGTSNSLAPSITPDGRTLLRAEFAAGSNPDILFSMHIGDDGSLTAINSVNIVQYPSESITSPNGRFVINFDNGAGGSTSPSFTSTAISPTGVLSHIDSTSVGAAGTFGVSGSMSPDGKFLYVPLPGGGANVLAYSLTADGSFALVSGGPFTSGVSFASSAAQPLAFIPAQGPIAKIASSGKGATRTLSASGSAASDGGAINSYAWDFGDGSTVSTSTESTTHKFTKPGVFDVTVRAAVDGCSTDQIYNGRWTMCNPGRAAATTVDALPPAITNLKLTKSKFKVNKKAKLPKTAKKSSGGTFATYKLSEAGTLTFQVEQLTKGRKVGKSCVKPKSSNKKKKPCTRYVKVGKSWKLSAKAGSRKTAFSGKVGSKSLKAGKYRLSIVATDASGNAASPKTVKFTILR
jgi:6-phosphogluconolactonase (cycloisomerase 2 family)